MSCDAAATTGSLPDSPLSVTASIAGILTFLYALAAGLLGYAYLFRASTPASVDRFYDAFAACALESDLVRRDMRAVQPLLPSDPAVRAATRASTDATRVPPREGGGPERPEWVEKTVSNAGVGGGRDGSTERMDPDSLRKLFEHVRAVEIELQKQAARVAEPTDADSGLWATLLGRGRWAGRVRELEASLGKRETLTARLLVVQMSLMSAYVSTISLPCFWFPRRTLRTTSPHCPCLGACPVIPKAEIGG